MRNRSKQSGFTLIELIVVLAVMAIGMVFLNSLITNQADRSQETLAALHARRVVEAAQRYVNDNSAALIASSTATTPTVLTVATLQSANYIPSEFSGVNPYNQSYQVRVIEPVAGQLSALVVTVGGNVIGEAGMRRIAKQIGPEGGYVSTATPTTATGAYSGWTTSLSTYGSTTGGGHIAAGLFFRDGQQVNDYIYRAVVAGHPELNEMATNLDMGNNNVANANQVTANGAVQGATVRATGRMYANEFVQLAGVVTTGTACGPNGTLGREPDGRLASCVSGVWRRAGF